jgi:3-deoxy-D-arabino-heptulosonate 7-phosphate (DAHP) synthase
MRRRRRSDNDIACAHVLVSVFVCLGLCLCLNVKNPGKPLKYGQSITDACIHWADTETVLHKLAQVLPHLKPLSSSSFFLTPG